MDYEVFFDATVYGFTTWTYALFSLPLVAVGIYFCSKPIEYFGSKISPKFINGFRYLYLVFAVFGAILDFSGTYSDYLFFKQVVENNEVMVVEGVVTNFREVARPEPERFCVDTVCFEYTEYTVTWGFHLIARNGSPIRDGLPVRITYAQEPYMETTRNIIVKLEIGQ